ncbi:unnamed protein product [Phaeothamnion confervicola]
MSAAPGDVGGKVLVSGFLDAKERTDQFVFDVLHAQGVWTKIVAFSPETAFAKKRLISRKSRYSGLLDVVEFDEGDRADTTVMEEKLKGCDAWLAFNCPSEALAASLDAAAAAGVKTVVMTTAATAEEVAASGVAEKLESAGLRYTLIRTGAVVEGKEGGPISIRDAGEALPIEEIARDELVRLAAEAFVLDGMTKKAMSIGTGDAVAAEYLKTLREKGLARRAEIEAVVSGGLKDFYKQKDDEEEAKKKAELTKADQDAQRKVEAAKREVEEKEWLERTRENSAKKRAEVVEMVAKKVLGREWRKLYWARDTKLTEDEYIAVPENWERGLRKGQKIVSESKGSFGTASDILDWEYEGDDDDTDDVPMVGASNTLFGAEASEPEAPKKEPVPAGGDDKKD